MHFLTLSPGERQVHAILDSLLEYDKGALDDKNLPAVAQLASFRTGTSRAVVSLRDEAYHHVLADITQATEGTAQCAPSQPSPSTHWHRIAREECLYEHGLSEKEEDAPQHLLSVEDCSGDPRFKEHTLVTGEDGIRFLTAVPMISSAGQQIGVLAVSNPAPRDPLSQKELDGLRECASCVVGHLELVRTSVDCSRKSLLLRGITSSIEHQYPSLRMRSGEELGAHHDQVFSDQSRTDFQGSAHSDGAAYSSKSNASSSMSSSEAQDALTGAFKEAARRLVRYLRAEDIAVYGEAGMGGVVVDDADRHHTSKDQPDPTERPSALLFSFNIEGSGRKPFGSFLRRLAEEHPRGKALQVIACGTNEEQNSPVATSVPIAEDLACNHSASESISDGQIVEHLLPPLSRRGLRNLVFLPVHHPQKSDLLAAFVLVNVSSPCTLDFSELQAAMNLLSQQMAHILSRKGEADFLSNFSHELRSPIHGVMGAAQFLQDITSSSYQTGLLESIFQCSSTLLDTLNLVLDHSKLGAVSQSRRISDVAQTLSSSGPSAASVFSSEPSDLALLVEEATESVVSGHFFDNMTRVTDPRDGRDQNEDKEQSIRNSFPSTYHDVKVIVALDTHGSWAVQAPPGAIRRIVMNLLGNSLKFTPHGSIVVALAHDPTMSSNETMLGFRIQVKDTGIGMSTEFQRDSLFVPFQQENRFESGVGLGLSVVRRIVESLDGTITVDSKLREGTLVDIGLSLPALRDPSSGTPDDIQEITSRVEGKHIVFIDPRCLQPDYEITEFAKQREEALQDVASNWFKMRVSKTSNMDVQDADYYLYSEPPPAHVLLETHHQTPNSQLSSGEIPLIVVATDSKEAHMIETYHAQKLEKAGRIVEVLSQPCGPRKLAKILRLCLNRQKQSMQNRTPVGEELPDMPPPSLADDPGKPSESKESSAGADREEKPFEEDRNPCGFLSLPLPARPKPEVSTALETGTLEETTQQQLSGPNASDHGLRGLLVDDNRVNLRLLVTLMKKSQHSYAEAEDGQQAVTAFKKGCAKSEKPFDFVLMDIGMPVMNGIEAAKLIREHERDHNLRPTQIIALTAWADAKTQEEAMAAGMDHFMSKPVNFPQLRKLLDDLRRSPRDP